MYKVAILRLLFTNLLVLFIYCFMIVNAWAVLIGTIGIFVEDVSFF